MAEPGDLEARVQRLEEKLEAAVMDAAAARVLAGGADRDVETVRKELRDFRSAITTTQNATRADIGDLMAHQREMREFVTDQFGLVNRNLAHVVEAMNVVLGDRMPPAPTDDEGEQDGR